MLSEEMSLNNTFNESTLKYSNPNKKAKYVPVKGAHHRRHTKVAPLPSTRTNGLHGSDQYANEREQSLLVWLNNEVEVGQSVLAKCCVNYFRDIHPIHMLFYNVIQDVLYFNLLLTIQKRWRCSSWCHKCLLAWGSQSTLQKFHACTKWYYYYYYYKVTIDNMQSSRHNHPLMTALSALRFSVSCCQNEWSL